ncbi:MAG: hypothetical protein HY914_09500 [Desulfomonile tiedjei]|nr:hypothetical protein [Desulfomonile tiedjei]
MERETTETVYTLVIIGLRDDRARRRVAAALSRVTTQMSADRILERLGKLPWTLTRRATRKRAIRLTRLLESLGARLQVIPPLPEDLALDVGETQIMPSAELLTETQVANATQFIQPPEESYSAESLPERPAMEARPAAVTPASAMPPEPRKMERALSRERETSAPESAPMEPLTIGGILDRTFQIGRAYFWKLAAIVVIPGLIAGAISLAGLLLGSVAGLALSSVLDWPAWVWVVGTIILIPVVVVGIAIFVFLPQAALIHAISEICLGRDFRVTDAFRAVLQKLLPFVLTSLLFMLALFGTMLATGLSGGVLGALYGFTASWVLPRSLVWLAWLPAILLIPVFIAVPLYAWVKWSLFGQALILEDAAYGEALQRSWRLLSGRAGTQWYTSHVTRLGILLLVFAVIQVSVSFLFQGPAVLFTYATPWQMTGKVATHVLSFCGNVVIGVFSATCTVLFYYDLRNRKEGLDLMLLAGENVGPRGE